MNPRLDGQGSFSILSLIFSLFLVSTSHGDEQQRMADLQAKVQPLLQEHCLDCHSGDEPDAGLTLDHFDTPLDFLKGRGVWEKAAQRMLIEEMPPPESSTLSDADRKYLIDWIDGAITDFECGLTPNPGKVTLRRLNAIEYQNTIRDLFGVRSYRPESAFAGDDVGYGFDNIGDVLTLPPLLMEKYFLEAERITRALIQTPPPTKIFERSLAGSALQLGKKSAGAKRRELVMTTTSTATLQEQIPWSGAYTLIVTAGGNQAGNDPCMMQVSVDGKRLRTIRVPNDADDPAEYRLKLRLRAGSREVAIRFMNDFYDKATKADRNLVVHHVVLNSKQASTARFQPNEQKYPYHRKIVFAEPTSDSDREDVTRKVIERWASMAFRRPVESDELQRLVDLAISVQAEGDSFEESIQIALQAILISPKFLFRVEPPRDGLDVEQYRDLDEFELASRLSYFLWSSMPDKRLLALAYQNKLREGNVLEFEIKRMIDDPRAKEFVRNFAGQWLTLRNLDSLSPDPRLFPKWNDNIRDLAVQETLTFFYFVMQKNMSVTRLLDADFTYLNDELARYYGIPGVRGDKFQPVSLKGTPRAGLLTQASILAVTSNPTRTSPVKRGKWLLENLLATPPPPAPPGVPELEEKKGALTGTLRQRLEQHRQNPACANCHKLMDPMGFALENFDAVGQYRTKDGNYIIDASGELPDGTRVQGALQLQQLLVENNKEQFVRCLTEKMLTYALGRGLEYYDKCAVDKIMADLKEDDRFSTLLVGIVRSDPFQKKGER